MTYLIITNTGHITQRDSEPSWLELMACDSGLLAIVRVERGEDRYEHGLRFCSEIEAQFYNGGGEWLDVPRCDVEG